MNGTTGRKVHLVLAAMSAIALSACGSSDGDGFTPPPPPPPGSADIATERVFTQIAFNQPLAMMQLPNNDTRWFVVQRGGVIYTFPNDPNVTPADVTVFANLSTIVNSAPGEAGLLGLSFHPNVSVNGAVYVSYTSPSGGLQSRVSRFQSLGGNPPTLNIMSEDVLLTLQQPFNNHNGGNMAFGPDGFLYVGFGDGGSAGDPGNNAQDTSNLFGTIIRINVDVGNPYPIPGGATGNPFFGSPQCETGINPPGVPCPEIFAWGLRNPWRWSFDSLNGDLWVGDVGQGNWEEIDRVELGMNYGWREREGAHCFNPASGCSTNFEDPITEYSHALGGSVTGGYVYRG
ncbi:MAG TPA: PQQ-dependent sugar dehydrogenase, partial [Woeseiaceae bacterium]|nr:PQQ-dependent sugar dehydrogenase [Woeseiaceae bacterium]